MSPPSLYTSQNVDPLLLQRPLSCADKYVFVSSTAMQVTAPNRQLIVRILENEFSSQTLIVESLDPDMRYLQSSVTERVDAEEGNVCKHLALQTSHTLIASGAPETISPLFVDMMHSGCAKCRSVAGDLVLASFQIFTVLSLEPDMITSFVVAVTTHDIHEEWPSSVCRHSPVPTSHTFK